MPVLTDKTVASSAYDTSGNGGRKLVRLASGNLYSAFKGATAYYIYKSTDNGGTWSLFRSWTTYTSFQDIALATDGVRIFTLLTIENNSVASQSWNEDGSANSSSLGETAQTALGNVSLTINEAGTALHAVWSSKNSSYTNSFNLRYAKATINANGSLTWGGIVQVTKNSSSLDDTVNPTIVLNKDGNPVIVAAETRTSYNQINVFRWNSAISNFDLDLVYQGATYLQNNPSAIFVPKSINGLANGRIWLAWSGLDGVDSSKPNIRVSYSDNGGVTWSTMQKLTSGNSQGKQFPSITANKNGKVNILYQSTEGQALEKLTYNGSWASSFDYIKTNVLNSNPNTLYDPTFNYREPLFVYKNFAESKVGFYGTWGTDLAAPKTPSSLTVPEALLGNSTATISWSAVPNDGATDGESITYQVEMLSPEDGKWISLANNVVETSKVVSIPKKQSGLAKIRVRAFDGNEYGGYITSSDVYLSGYLGGKAVDTTVVSSAYDTNGNGGRKLVRLSNGWLVASAGDSNAVYFYLSKDDGVNWTQLCFTEANGFSGGWSIVSKGTNVHLIMCFTTGNINVWKFDAVTVTNTKQLMYKQILAVGETAIAGANITINEAKTQLHATWSSKNASLPNSWNIRYAKGTIGSDGNVTWGTEIQVTNDNTAGYDNTSPSIVVNSNNIPVITYSRTQTSANNIMRSAVLVGASFLSYTVFHGAGYVQLSSSAIFVPKSINGLVNGRIWVAWRATSATSSGNAGIVMAYSDDGGFVWSALINVAVGASGQNYDLPTISANSNNDIFIVYWSSSKGIVRKKYSGTTLGEEVLIKSGGTQSSSLNDSTISFSEPMLVYRDTAKIGFYGTWYNNSSAPKTPSSITVPGILTGDNTATISWSAVPNDGAIDGESITYQLDMYIPEDNIWINMADGVAETSKVISIPKKQSGVTKIRVRAFDGYVYGDYIISDDVLLSGYLGGNIVDSTIVTQPYGTSGNGGRKLIRLDNGWLVSILSNNTTSIMFFASKDDGVTWKQIAGSIGTVATFRGASIASKGTKVYAIFGDNNTTIKSATFDVVEAYSANDIWFAPTMSDLDTQTSFSNGVTLYINESGTELHAAWSSRNSTYPNSFNIRYRKGTIDGDGKVIWGTVEQVTTDNTNAIDSTYPTIVVTSLGDKVIIFKRQSMIQFCRFNGTTWARSILFNNDYEQLTPSATFVPKSINGLDNGRIWVAWMHGHVSAAQSLAYSYSDNGGVSWATAKIYNVGSNYVPSITFNKTGKVFVIFEKLTGKGRQIYRAELDGTGWINETLVTPDVASDRRDPSTLVDASLDYDSPLFIHKNLADSKVSFYGTWNKNLSIPKAPSSITVPKVLVGGENVNISWSEVPNEEALIGETITYQIDIQNPEDDTWINVADDVVGTSKAVKVPIKQSGVSKVRVRAFDGSDYGEYIVSDSVYLSGSSGVNAIDVTVVAQPYDTSGNGGRKIVRLDSGRLIAGAWVGSGSGINFYSSDNNGATWKNILNYVGAMTTLGFSMVSKGNMVYVLIAYNNVAAGCLYFDGGSNSPTINGTATIDPQQTATGQCSLTINEAKTELHAAWTSKNAAYPTSMNIRYAKGVIQADGNVLWGAVARVTQQSNVSFNMIDPTIVLKENGHPSIMFISDGGASGYIVFYNSFNGTSWDTSNSFRGTIVYNGGTHSQSAPSAVFVPKKINGLTNGRIWLTWYGHDATDPSVRNIRVIFSDDGGVTWSSMQKLTSGNIRTQLNPSITANKKNEVFVVWQGHNGTRHEIKQIKFSGSTWGEVEVINSGVDQSNYPATLFDNTFTLDFTSPFFIYQLQNNKVGFYGKLITIVMSVPQGPIGEKSDRTNLLEYVITTENEMTPIREKINGVLIGTKTAVSGEPLIVGLTQEQWDSMRYGKYQEIGDTNLISAEPIDWDQGSYTGAGVGQTLTPIAGANDIRLKNPLLVEPNTAYIITIADGYMAGVFETNGSDQTIRTSTWIRDELYWVTSSTAKKLFIIIDPKIGGAINPPAVLLAQPKIAKYIPVEHTLTIEMENMEWAYTFDKRLVSDVDTSKVIKAIQDSNEVYLPSMKNRVASAVRNQGGTVSVEATLEEIESAVSNIKASQIMTGSIVSSGTSKYITTESNGSSITPFVDFNFSMLPFVPKRILFYPNTRNSNTVPVWNLTDNYYAGENNRGNSYNGSLVAPHSSSFRVPYVNGVVSIPVLSQNTSYDWVAYKD